MKNSKKLKKIKELLELKDNGIISDEEFEIAKVDIVNGSIITKESRKTRKIILITSTAVVCAIILLGLILFSNESIVIEKKYPDGITYLK